MAGNKKPNKKYNPNKPSPTTRFVSVVGKKVGGLGQEQRNRIHQPIDVAIHRLGAGGASVVDFHNALYRALVGKMMAVKFCVAADQEFFDNTYDMCLRIKERNERELEDPRKNLWSITASEYATMLDTHCKVIHLHDNVHRKHFVSTYKAVNDIVIEMLKEFDLKHPPRIENEVTEDQPA